MRYAQKLWPGQAFPDWDAERCFALFQKKVSKMAGRRSVGLDRDEENEFALQVMNLVALYFGRNGLIESLDEMGLGSSDVAQEIVAFIVERCGRFKLRAPMYKVMLAALNTTIRNRVADAIARVKKDVSLDEEQMLKCIPGNDPSSSLDRLAHLLGLDKTRIMVCEGIPGRNPKDEIYRHQTRKLIQDNTLSPHREMPAGVRGTDYQHGLVTTRLVRLVREFASDN